MGRVRINLLIDFPDTSVQQVSFFALASHGVCWENNLRQSRRLDVQCEPVMEGLSPVPPSLEPLLESNHLSPA